LLHNGLLIRNIRNSFEWYLSPLKYSAAHKGKTILPLESAEKKFSNFSKKF